MVKAFGDLLRLHRAAAGLSQAGLADRAGLSPQAVGSLERGRRTRPRRHTVLSLADALGLDGVKRKELLISASAAGHRRRHGRARPDDTAAVEVEQADAIPVVPRSLPPAVADFTGRDDHVQRLRDLIASTTVPSVVVVAIEGMGGVGKTTLAVHVAHLLADQFPDGQLYVDLRGFGPGDPMTTSEVLGLLLRSLGVSVTDAGGIDYAASRYRSAIAGKRMLVLLDNAADVEQVKALLPGTAGCAAIVTSRRFLSTLPGTRHLQLDVLAGGEAVALLGAIAGEGRVLAELAAANDVVRRCARLPLAIRMAGARLLARPQWPISVLAEELSDEHRRLDVLEQQDVGVRTTFAVSLRQLADSDDPVDNAAAAAFPVLGLPDGPDLSLTVVARLLDMSETETLRILDRLVDSYLLETHLPGRYRLHDLLRTYARERVGSTVDQCERAAALTRVLKLYNSMAWRAHELWRPGNNRRLFADDRWFIPIPDLDEKDVVLSWLDDERPHLLAAIRQAAGMPTIPQALVSQLSMGLIGFYWVRQHWADLIETSKLALGVAAASGDQVAEAFAHNDLAAVTAELGHDVEAADEMRRAVDLFRSAGALRGEAGSLCNLGYLLHRLDQPAQGLEVARRALELNQKLGDRQRTGQAWLVLGMLHGRLGDSEREMAFIEKSRECHLDSGNGRGLADALYQIGMAHQRSGRHEEGLLALAECVPLCTELDLPGSIAEAHIGMADIHLDMGRWAEAAASAQTALSVALRTTYPYAEAHARSVLGSALAGMGRQAEARDEWERALSIFDGIGSANAKGVRALLAQGMSRAG